MITPEKQITSTVTTIANNNNNIEASSISPSSSSFLNKPIPSLSPITPYTNSKLVQFATVGIAHKVEEILNDKINYSPSVDEKGWALMVSKSQSLYIHTTYIL